MGGEALRLEPEGTIAVTVECFSIFFLVRINRMPLRTEQFVAQPGTLVFICTEGRPWGNALAKTLQLLNAAEQTVFIPDFDAMRVAEQLRPFWPDPRNTRIPYLGTCIARPRTGDSSGPQTCLRLLAQLRDACWCGGFIGVFSNMALVEDFLSLDAFGGPPNGQLCLARLGNFHRAIVAPLSMGELLGELTSIGHMSKYHWVDLERQGCRNQVCVLLEGFVTTGCDDLEKLDNIRLLARTVKWHNLLRHQDLARIDRLLSEGPGMQRNGWAREVLRLVQRNRGDKHGS